MRNPVTPRPRYLPTVAAASYCLTSRRGLLRAYRAGELSPAGRRGRTFTWDIEELDRWMRGEPVKPRAAAPVPAEAAAP